MARIAELTGERRKCSYEIAFSDVRKEYFGRNAATNIVTKPRDRGPQPATYQFFIFVDFHSLLDTVTTYKITDLILFDF